MARKRGSRQKQSKNAKNSAKAEAKAQARAMQELEDEQYLSALEMQAQNEALVTSATDAVAAGNANNGTSTATNGCGIADILSVTDKLLDSIVQSLTKDMGVEGLDVDYKNLVLAKVAKELNGIDSSAAASNLPPEPENPADNETRDKEAIRAMHAENELLRAQLAQKEAEVVGLSRVVEAQKAELFVARSQVARLDAFIVHELGQILNYISFPAGVSRLIQGLQYQYALREEHFAIIEQTLALESQLWQEKCRLAEARELKAQVREAEEKEKENKRLLLESEQKNAKTRRIEAEVKLKLDECIQLLETLDQCNTDVRETMNYLTRDLYVDTRDVSCITDALKQMGQNKTLQPMQIILERGQLGDEYSIIPTSEHCDKHSLANCSIDAEDVMQDLEPLMSKLVSVLPSCDPSSQNHVMVGKSPRVIRMPRRRDSHAKDKPSPNKVSSGSDKMTDQTASSKTEAKPVFLSVPSGQFTFLSP